MRPVGRSAFAAAAAAVGKPVFSILTDKERHRAYSGNIYFAELFAKANATF